MSKRTYLLASNHVGSRSLNFSPKIPTLEDRDMQESADPQPFPAALQPGHMHFANSQKHEPNGFFGTLENLNLRNFKLLQDPNMPEYSTSALKQMEDIGRPSNFFSSS